MVDQRESVAVNRASELVRAREQDEVDRSFAACLRGDRAPVLANREHDARRHLPFHPIDGGAVARAVRERHDVFAGDVGRRLAIRSAPGARLVGARTARSVARRPAASRVRLRLARAAPAAACCREEDRRKEDAAKRGVRAGQREPILMAPRSHARFRMEKSRNTENAKRESRCPCRPYLLGPGSASVSTWVSPHPPTPKSIAIASKPFAPCAAPLSPASRPARTCSGSSPRASFLRVTATSSA